MHTISANGAEIPALGFGTFELEAENALRMVGFALDIGYRHIDTAQMYGNEQAVGEALEHASVARGEVFVTTKVWPDRFRDGALQRSVEESLERLRSDYVDLLLLHWPNPEVPLRETLRALNEVHREGMARHIGVSNFTTSLIREAVALSDAPLAVDQVEYHPFLSQDTVRAELERHGMALIAYCPVAKGRVLGNDTLRRIGGEHGKNEIQVTLRWLLQQKRVAAIPRTRDEAHAEANLDIFDFELNPDEMHAIGALARRDGRITDPAGLAPRWDDQ